MEKKLFVFLVLVGTFGCESGFVDVDDTSADSQLVEQQNYTGVIKKFEDGGYEQFGLYIESSSGIKTGLSSCDKRVDGVWAQVVETAKTGNEVTIYGTETKGGICVKGIELDLGLNIAYTGLIKEVEDNGYEQFGFYLEESLTGTQTWLSHCDQGVDGVWEQVVDTAKIEIEVTIYGTRTAGGLCVNGITVNY